MQKNKLKLISAACAALALCLTMTACNPASASSASPSPEATATPEATPTASPTPDPEEGLTVVGTKSDVETVYKVILENSTEADIIGISIKDSSMEEFPESLLEEDVTLAAGDKFVLYFDTAALETDEGESSTESDAGDDILIEAQYDIEITLTDDVVYVLHAFPFGDIEEGAILLDESDEVAYITYTSVETKKEIETKEAELAILETETRDGVIQSYEGEEVSENPLDYMGPGPAVEPEPEQPVYTEPGPVVEPEPEEPVYTEPGPVVEEPVYTEPEAPAAGNDDGCVGDDALFN